MYGDPQVDFLWTVVQHINENSRIIITAMHSGDGTNKCTDIDHLDGATIVSYHPRKDLYR